MPRKPEENKSFIKKMTSSSIIPRILYKYESPIQKVKYITTISNGHLKLSTLVREWENSHNFYLDSFNKMPMLYLGFIKSIQFWDGF